MATVEELRLTIKAEVGDAVSKLKQFKRTTEESNKEAADLGKSFASLRDIMQGPVGLAKAAMNLGTQIVRAMDQSIMAAADASLAFSNLASTLKATGSAMSFEGLTAAAEQLAKTSLFEDDDITQAQAVLTTFKAIGKDIFPQATQAAADMATVMGMDLQQATVMIGKALNDPIQGIGALRRVGVQLTDQQEEMVKQFIAVNDIASAQKVIMGELVSQFGGAAGASSQTATGIYQNMKKSAGEAREAWGTFLAVITKDAARDIGIALDDVASKISKKAIAIEAGNIWADALENGGANLDTMMVQINSVGGGLADITAEAASLRQEISANKEFARMSLEAGGITQTYMDQIKLAEEQLAVIEKIMTKIKSKEVISLYGDPNADKKTAEQRAKNAAAESKRLADALASDIASTQRRYSELSDVVIKATQSQLAYTKSLGDADGDVVNAIRRYDELAAVINRANESGIAFSSGLSGETVNAVRRYGELAEVVARATQNQTALINKTKEVDDSMRNLFEGSFKSLSTAIGESMVKGIEDQEDAWATLGKAAKDVIAGMVEAIGQKMLVQAGEALATALIPLGALGIPAALAGAGIAFAAAGAIRAIPMAEGGSGVVSKPTLFLAGEKGPEPYAFGGANNKRGMGGTTIIVHGSVITQRELESIAVSGIERMERGW